VFAFRKSTGYQPLKARGVGGALPTSYERP
jgi:hypothetical protein